MEATAVQNKPASQTQAPKKQRRISYTIFEQDYLTREENLDEMVVCTDKEICSAKPALPTFEMSVNDIFKKPEMVKEK